MARRRKSEEGISLFPFLSILCCVIGVLTLIIVSMALGSMDEEVIERARKYQLITNDIKTQLDEIARLEELVKNVDAIREQLALADAELKRIQKQQQDLEKRDDVNVQLLAQLNRSRKRVTEMESERKELNQTLAKLQNELKRRKEPPGEAEVVIQPSGSGTNLVPRFVECRPEGVVIYEGDKQIRVRRGDLRSNQDFLKLLDDVAQKAKTDRIVFLLREDGIPTYNAARAIANERLAPNGKLAVQGQGKIDLSLFTKKK